MNITKKTAKIPSTKPKNKGKNKMSYSTKTPFFYIEGVDDNAGRYLFCIVVTNAEIENLDTLVSTIMEDEYQFYTTWNDPDIYHDYMIYVKPKWRAGDGLLPWADELLKKYVSKRVAQLQDEFKRSHVSSVDE